MATAKLRLVENNPIFDSYVEEPTSVVWLHFNLKGTKRDILVMLDKTYSRVLRMQVLGRTTPEYLQIPREDGLLKQPAGNFGAYFFGDYILNQLGMTRTGKLVNKQRNRETIRLLKKCAKAKRELEIEDPDSFMVGGDFRLPPVATAIHEKEGIFRMASWEIVKA